MQKSSCLFSYARPEDKNNCLLVHRYGHCNIKNCTLGTHVQCMYEDKNKNKDCSLPPTVCPFNHRKPYLCGVCGIKCELFGPTKSDEPTFTSYRKGKDTRCSLHQNGEDCTSCCPYVHQSRGECYVNASTNVAPVSVIKKAKQLSDIYHEKKMQAIQKKELKDDFPALGSASPSSSSSSSNPWKKPKEKKEEEEITPATIFKSLLDEQAALVKEQREIRERLAEIRKKLSGSVPELQIYYMKFFIKECSRHLEAGTICNGSEIIDNIEKTCELDPETKKTIIDGLRKSFSTLKTE